LQLTYACLVVDVFCISTSLGSPRSPEVINSGVSLTYIPHAGTVPTAETFGVEVATVRTVSASAIRAVCLKGTSSTFLQRPSVSSPTSLCSLHTLLAGERECHYCIPYIYLWVPYLCDSAFHLSVCTRLLYRPPMLESLSGFSRLRAGQHAATVSELASPAEGTPLWRGLSKLCKYVSCTSKSSQFSFALGRTQCP